MSSPTPTSQGPGIEKYGSKTDAFIKVMLVFFISLLSFSVGTYVGKKFSDKEHKLAQLEPQGPAKDHETESEHGEKKVETPQGHAENHNEARKTEALSDDEIAKLAQEFVSEDEVKNKIAEIETPKEALDDEAEVQVPVVEAKQPVAPVAVKAPEVKKVTPTVREVASVDLKQPEKAIHESTKRTVATIAKKTESNVESTKATAGKYTVQVSAFTNEKDAHNLKSELDSKGLSTLIVPAEVKGKKYFRVSVGLFKTESEAKVYLKDLLLKDVVKSAIVQKVAL